MIYSHDGAQNKKKNLRQENLSNALAKIIFEKTVKSEIDKVFEEIDVLEKQLKAAMSQKTDNKEEMRELREKIKSIRLITKSAAGCNIFRKRKIKT